MADKQLANGSRGPLLGVPVTIKEAFNVAGMDTTWGSPAFRDYLADSDATVVERLKRAGAIVVGKTNTHFMLADFPQTLTTCTAQPPIRWTQRAIRATSIASGLEPSRRHYAVSFVCMLMGMASVLTPRRLGRKVRQPHCEQDLWVGVGEL